MSSKKRMSVDASDKKKLITIVDVDSSTVIRDSTLNYSEHKSHSDEAEFCGIVCALKNYPEIDLEILIDCKSIVDILNHNGKVSPKRKHYVEKIEELCNNRTVLFRWESRDFNEAGLKQDGYSLFEIRKSELLQMRTEMKKEMKEKYSRIKKRQCNKGK